MSANKDYLDSILCTAQVERSRLESVLCFPMRPTLRRCLESKLKEFDSIEREAMSIGLARGWDLQDLEPPAKLMQKASTRAKLFHGHTDSKIAGLMIKSSTNVLVEGIRKQHQFDSTDQRITTLSQKLLDCENAIIRQMQGFL